MGLYPGCDGRSEMLHDEIRVRSLQTIGHIHNANFAQTQFSTSHPQKQHFLKSRRFTFLWQYSVCGLKFKISEYPLKSPYVTHSPYQYELKRIKNHEMRAKNFRLNLFS